MDIPTRNRIGNTQAQVTALGFGGSSIGNFLRTMTDNQARSLIDQAWDQGVRYYDTATLYGHGLSEYRMGHALHERRRSEYALLTKVGRTLSPAPPGSFDSGLWMEPAPMAVTYDYTYDGIMRSAEDSMQRLLTDHLDMMLVHDVDVYTHGTEAQKGYFETAVTDGFRALEKLRDEGVVSAIGFGVNETDVLNEAVERTDSDVVLLAGRYTLLEQEPLDDLLPLCASRNTSVILGGVYNSGILATGSVEGAKFNYSVAPGHIRARVSQIEDICRSYDVPLPAAALQFAYAHPAVASICIGSRNERQQEQTARYCTHPIPDQFWDDLRENGLLRSDAPTPGSADEGK